MICFFANPAQHPVSAVARVNRTFTKPRGRFIDPTTWNHTSGPTDRGPHRSTELRHEPTEHRPALQKRTSLALNAMKSESSRLCASYGQKPAHTRQFKEHVWHSAPDSRQLPGIALFRMPWATSHHAARAGANLSCSMRWPRNGQSSIYYRPAIYLTIRWYLSRYANQQCEVCETRMPVRYHLHYHDT